MPYRTIKLASSVPVASSQPEFEPHPGASDKTPDGHLDKALDLFKTDRFEEAIELWKIYGES